MQLGRTFALVRLMRPANALAVFAAFGVGFTLSGADWSNDALIGLCVLALVHSAATLQNDVADVDVDGANRRKTALVSGHVTAPEVQRLFWQLTLIALILSVLGSARLMHVAATVVFTALAWLYNNKPFRLSRRPISSIALLGICYGALPLAYGYLIGGGALSVWFGALAAAWFVRRVSVSILKDYKDASGDWRHNKRTFYLVFGRRVTAWTSIALMTIGFGGIAWLLSPLLLRAGILLLPAGLLLCCILVHCRLVAEQNEQHLAVLFRKAFIRQTLFELSVALCLLSS